MTPAQAKAMRKEEEIRKRQEELKQAASDAKQNYNFSKQKRQEVMYENIMAHNSTDIDPASISQE